VVRGVELERERDTHVVVFTEGSSSRNGLMVAGGERAEFESLSPRWTTTPQTPSESQRQPGARAPAQYVVASK
jgi:hypothetical protein